MKKCLYILTLALILLCTSISFAETVCEESEKEIIKKLGYGIVSEKKCTNERSRDLRQQLYILDKDLSSKWNYDDQ